MKKIAIISDIHANIEALTAVLDDISNRKVDAIYCLGDVIGYGPNPIECFTIATNRFEIIVKGNHEEGVVDGAYGVSAMAKDAMDWTREVMKPQFYSLPHTKKLWHKLENLPLTFRENNMLFVHGSPRCPTQEYILEDDTQDIFGEIPEKIAEIFSCIDQFCFVGHSHKPGIINDKSEWIPLQKFDYTWEVKRGEKIICNVGSVGQPRDRDNRSCYVTFDGKRICYHRIPYDWSQTQEKIRKLPKLDNRLADRLEVGH
ncbi:metallophosphoesterase [Candidatus Uabimicrobium sp. HlEnr_7]|uniref:metallophosphoesterase family protein n=1 Tax=Candidatus Uabimicrobium helgolandensis TaxID=3095367 RepID=UPI003558586F